MGNVDVNKRIIKQTKTNTNPCPSLFNSCCLSGLISYHPQTLTEVAQPRSEFDYLRVHLHPPPAPREIMASDISPWTLSCSIARRSELCPYSLSHPTSAYQSDCHCQRNGQRNPQGLLFTGEVHFSCRCGSEEVMGHYGLLGEMLNQCWQ